MTTTSSGQQAQAAAATIIVNRRGLWRSMTRNGDALSISLAILMTAIVLSWFAIDFFWLDDLYRPGLNTLWLPPVLGLAYYIIQDLMLKSSLGQSSERISNWDNFVAQGVLMIAHGLVVALGVLWAVGLYPMTRFNLMILGIFWVCAYFENWNSVQTRLIVNRRTITGIGDSHSHSSS